MSEEIELLRRQVDEDLRDELNALRETDRARHEKLDAQFDAFMVQLNALTTQLSALLGNEAIQYIMQYPGTVRDDLRQLKEMCELLRSVRTLLQAMILIGGLLTAIGATLAFFGLEVARSGIDGEQDRVVQSESQRSYSRSEYLSP